MRGLERQVIRGLDPDLSWGLDGVFQHQSVAPGLFLGFILLPSLQESSSRPGTENQNLKHSCWSEVLVLSLRLSGQQTPNVT